MQNSTLESFLRSKYAAMNILWYAAQLRNGGTIKKMVETSLCDGRNLTLLIGIRVIVYA